MEFRVHVGTLRRSIVCAENKRNWKNQAFINYYFEKYYGIF